MSCVMIKPIFCICEKQRHRLAALSLSLIIIVFHCLDECNLNFRFCGYKGWFVSCPVVNHEDKFSCDKAYNRFEPRIKKTFFKGF